MPEHVDVFFRKSPAFRLSPEAVLQGVRPTAWFDSEIPVAQRLGLGTAVPVRRRRGRRGPAGQRILCCSYGPEIAMRRRPHGTFKLLFNGIYYDGRP